MTTGNAVAPGFRFDPEVRKHVKALLGLMVYANGRVDGRWAYQTGGVYGAAYDTLRRILIEVAGQEVYDRLELLGEYATERGVSGLEEDIAQTRADLVEEAAVMSAGGLPTNLPDMMCHLMGTGAAETPTGTTIPLFRLADGGQARLGEPGKLWQVDRETYWYYLEILPPRWMDATSRVFAFGEGEDPLRLFWRGDGGQYYCRQTTEAESRHFCQLANISRANG